MSFALAKDWLLRQQRTQSQALEVGAVNEEAREVISELNLSLSEQPTSTAALLDQPARSAAPVIPVPQLSHGPEPVMEEIRANERQQLLRQKTGMPKPAKKKVVSSEMEDQQLRAYTRMKQLGVIPIDEKAREKKHPCPVCGKLRTANDKTPDEQIHRVLGR